ENNPADQHAIMSASLHRGKGTLRIKLGNDFGVGYSRSQPPLGSSSRDPRIIPEHWNPAHDELTLQTAGIAGSRYELDLWNPGQIRSIEGAELKDEKLIVTLPSGDGSTYTPHRLVLHFASAERVKK